MSVTLTSTGIQFPDLTTQTTAAGEPSTATILNAIAAATVGSVGTYAWLWSTNTTPTSLGGTKAGSNLRYAGISSRNSGTTNTVGLNDPSNVFAGNGGTPAGTWRCMGRDYGAGYPNYLYGITLWLRIS